MKKLDLQKMIQCSQCGDWVTKAVTLDVKGLGEMEGLFCSQQCGRVELERNLSFGYRKKDGDAFQILKEKVMQ